MFPESEETKSTGRPGAKMKLGTLMANVKDAASLESSKSTPPANSVSGIVSSASSRKISEKDKDKKKSGLGLSKFKTGFFGKGKKKVEKDSCDKRKGTETEAVFPRERELTDEESLLRTFGDGKSNALRQDH